MCTNLTTVSPEPSRLAMLRSEMERADKIRGLMGSVDDTIEVASADLEHLSSRRYLCFHIADELTEHRNRLEELYDWLAGRVPDFENDDPDA